MNRTGTQITIKGEIDKRYIGNVGKWVDEKNWGERNYIDEKVGGEM